MALFRLCPAEGESEADMARHRAEVLLDVLRGQGFAAPNPRPMFPNPPGLLRVEPHSEGLRDESGGVQARMPLLPGRRGWA